MCLLGKGGLPRQTLESPSLEILKKTKKKRKQKKSIGYSPEQPAEMTLLCAGGLDYMILRGPF